MIHCQKLFKIWRKRRRQNILGREDPNHVSFFPAWGEEGAACRLWIKLSRLKRCFFLNMTLACICKNIPQKEGVFTSFMYCSPKRGQCILIEGTGGITDSSLTACNPNMRAMHSFKEFYQLQSGNN